METKPKKSRRYTFLFLFLGILVWLILVLVVSFISLLSLGQVFTFNNLVTLHTSYPVFLFMDVLALVSVLLLAWVGWEKDRLRDSKNQAEWLTQNNQMEIQKQQEAQVETDTKYQGEIAQLNGKLEEQGKNFLELESIIRRGKQQWEGTFDAVDDLILLTSEAGSILRCNRATGEFFQLGYSQILGREIDDLFASSPESLQGMVTGEKKQIKMPQAEVWYEISKNHLLIDGKQEGWVYIFRNISAQKQALQEQQRLTHYYELLVNNNPVAIVTLNLEDRIIDCNPAFEKLFLYNKRESLGWKADLLVSPNDMADENQRMAEAVHRGETVHKVTQRRRKDGSLLDVEVFWIPVILGGKQFGSLGLYHDVTELVRSQKAAPEETEQVSDEAARILMAKFVKDAFLSQGSSEEVNAEPYEEAVAELYQEPAAELSQEVGEELTEEAAEPFEEAVAEPLDEVGSDLPESIDVEEVFPEEMEAVPLEEPALETVSEEQVPELKADEDVEPASPVIETRKRLVPVEKIEGIGPIYAQKLLEIGVKTTEDLLDQGKTRKGREDLVEKTGISSTLVLKWVNMADLMRIHGIGEEYSELLEKAGVDTVKELRNRKPQNLFEAILQANEAHKLVRRLPHLSEVEGWVKEAKELGPVVTY